MSQNRWGGVEALWPRVERMAWRVAHGRPELYEHLRDAALERYPSIAAEWDETREVPLEAWVMFKLGFIMRKRVGPWLRRRARMISMDVDEWQEPEAPPVSDAALEVRTILETLDPVHRDILVMRDMLGMSFTDIAAKIGVGSHVTASKYYREALEAARAQCSDG